MTWGKKLASSLFAVVLGASLAFVPVLAFADEEAPGSKGIADQFAFDEEATDEGAAAQNSTADSGNAGVVVGEDASGEWEQQAAPSNYVFDEKGLFNSSQLAELEQKAKSIADKYGVGAYFITCDYMNGLANPTSDERTRFASAYYMDHSLGLGSDKSGIMCVVAVDSRDIVIVGYGRGKSSISSDGAYSIEDDVKGYLGDNDWFGGAKAYYDDVDSQLAYFQQHGKPGKPIGAFGYILRIGLIVIIPLIIALAAVGGMKRKMKTAVEKVEARDYLDQSSLVLTASEDTFINSSVIATPRSESKGGGGGGGGWGGGGGGFSSTGGSKF